MHIKKLVVGIESLEDFARYQAREAKHVRYDGSPANVIHTRYKPKDADAVLAAEGSAYRIIKGKMRCRQKILGFEMVEGGDGRSYCQIYTDPTLIETYHVPHRPFQGWRYLKPADIPKDIGAYDPNAPKDDMPEDMREELRSAGLL